MRLLLTTVVIACAFLLSAASCQEKSTPTGQKREGTVVAENKAKAPAFEPQVAGGFYPASADTLRTMVSGYLQKAQSMGKQVAGSPLGIIVPHAGYPYSGPVAAFAFQAVRGRATKRVVVLGPAHRYHYTTPVLLDRPAYRTPLGEIPIDAAGVRKLAASGAAKVDESRFRSEHTLEVQLPFLQVVLKDFELVPVMISGADPAVARKLAGALEKAFPGNDTLFVASTDMSHDYPYDVAVAMDENAIRYVTALDVDGLAAAYRAFRKAGGSVRIGDDGKLRPDCAQLCGMGPVLTLLELAKLKGDAAVTVMDRRNSGDIVGDTRSRIVGYFSAVVTAGQEQHKEQHKEGEHAGSTVAYLSGEEEAALLKIARETLEAFLSEGKRKDFEPELAKLKEPGAAFVTLKNKGRLRGCIGYMEPVDPLWKMIRDRAIDAAINDRRFRPVTKEELPQITVEISVLTPRVKVQDPLKEIVIGRDGAWLEIGRNRGVFLPQVPVEQNWNTVEEYLDHLCRKAGVHEKGCWKSEDASIQRFAAQVFTEGE
jgi:AmmeMemoRadiSam system protein B/AmmeMemoRadiSam system protein A